MKYELVYILTPKLTEDEAKKEADNLSKKLAEKGAEVLRQDFWGKRKLAYQVQKLDHGYYVLVVFEAKSEVPGKLEKMFQEDEKLLRCLIVKYEEGAKPFEMEKSGAKTEEKTIKEKKEEEKASKLESKEEEEEKMKVEAEMEEETEGEQKELEEEGEEKEEKEGKKEKKEEEEKGKEESKKKDKVDVDDLSKRLDDILDQI